MHLVQYRLSHTLHLLGQSQHVNKQQFVHIETSGSWAIAFTLQKTRPQATTHLHSTHLCGVFSSTDSP